MGTKTRGACASILASEYWDCDCVADYINPRTTKYCPRCQAYRDNNPDSRAAEVAAAGFEIFEIEIPGQGVFRRRKK